eukprot:2473795-Rhodomonas_salina.3
MEVLVLVLDVPGYVVRPARHTSATRGNHARSHQDQDRKRKGIEAVVSMSSVMRRVCVSPKARGAIPALFVKRLFSVKPGQHQSSDLFHFPTLRSRRTL